MKHYLKSKDGEIKYTADMYCEHPNMKKTITRKVLDVTVLAVNVNMVWRPYRSRISMK